MQYDKVRVLLDSDGYLILAGHPSVDDKQTRKELMDCIKDGGTVKTISIDEYRATKFTWIYDKPNSDGK